MSEFKVGDRVRITMLVGGKVATKGDTGTIVGHWGVSSPTTWFVQFDPSPTVKMERSNSNWSGPELGVWAVEECMMEKLAESVTAPVAAPATGWQPDRAVDNIMDLTRGMFE